MQTLPLSGTDIVVQSKDGDLLAVVEIRNPIDLPPEYAATIRRSLIEHSRINRAARFFLIVSQDAGYLWDQAEFPSIQESLPDVTFSMSSIVKHYRPEHEPTERLPSPFLETIVERWFWDLSRNDQSRLPPMPLTLSETAFPELFRGSHINYAFELELER